MDHIKRSRVLGVEANKGEVVLHTTGMLHGVFHKHMPAQPDCAGKH